MRITKPPYLSVPFICNTKGKRMKQKQDNLNGTVNSSHWKLCCNKLMVVCFVFDDSVPYYSPHLGFGRWRGMLNFLHLCAIMLY